MNYLGPNDLPHISGILLKIGRRTLCSGLIFAKEYLPNQDVASAYVRLSCNIACATYCFGSVSDSRSSSIRAHIASRHINIRRKRCTCVTSSDHLLGTGSHPLFINFLHLTHHRNRDTTKVERLGSVKILTQKNTRLTGYFFFQSSIMSERFICCSCAVPLGNCNRLPTPGKLLQRSHLTLVLLVQCTGIHILLPRSLEW